MKQFLKNEEVSFLSLHGFSAADVFDGRPLSSGNERGRLAKKAAKLFVLRDPSRSKCGHRLTTRKGHCIQCDTAKIAYAKRHDEPAFVYIAGSLGLRGIKIGVTQDIEQRLANLNSQAYAGLKDWEMLFYVFFFRAGAVETTAQEKLSGSSISRTTFKDGRNQETKEVFNCSFQEAYQAVAKAAQELNLTPQEQAWKSRKIKKF